MKAPPAHLVVGVGSPAGGMEALAALFGNLPADQHISCVVGHCLSPSDRRRLVELIGRETGMTVKEIEPGEVAAGNTVYVAPANHGVVLRDGKLHLLARAADKDGAAMVVAIEPQPAIAGPAQVVSPGDRPEFELDDDSPGTPEHLQSLIDELATVNGELVAENFELERQNHDLSSLLNTIGLPVLEVDADLRLTRFNEAAARLLQLRDTEPGSRFSHIELPAWAAELTRHVSLLFSRRAPRALHLSDGRRRFSLVSYAAAAAPGGTSRAVLCLVDTTRADATAQVLSDQQEQLMAILNSSADAIRLLDREGRLVYANDALFSLLDLPQRRRGNGGAIPRIPAAIARGWREHDRRALAGSDSCALVEERVQVGASERLLETRRVPIRGEDGEIRLLCATSSDVTERRRGESQLRLAAQVFEASGEAIMITDAVGTIISINPAFTRITGYAPDDVIGRTPRILSSGRQDKAFYQQMWKAIGEAGRWQGEIWNRRKDGEVFPEWVSISAVAHEGEGGGPRNYIAIYTDISERKASEERVRHLAQYDFLTDLPNRALFADRLKQAIGAAQRDGSRLALMFIDLDHFKTINDSLGHNVGDMLLREVAQRLASVIRVSDTVSRQGGDEFLVLAPRIESPNDAARIAQKLTESIAEPFHLEGRKLVVTPSIGIALFPDDGTDMGNLIRNADAAMYHAKQHGRNAYQFFTADMNARAMERLTMETHLRHAIEDRQLVLYYQPQVSLASGAIVAVEALIRWNHPELGLVLPARFIPVAEETGQVTNIGEWVLRTATAQIMSWQSRGMPPVPVAVNLSALQFKQGRLHDQVADALAAAGLEPRYLQLEMTESVLMTEGEATATSMAALRAMEIEFAIDDFGTGYSSLAYLNRFRVGKLKIDQSFIRDLRSGNDSRKIVAAIIGLAKSLGLRVLAEGVETGWQADFLRASGCDEVQGFLFGRPMAAAHFEQFLAGGQFDIGGVFDA
ncbi:MAG: EAL domain-containing protein [Sterolibacteriaceae bacterium]|nr:EAL domain-containing protein [Candidatus Methylophosphatis haderslevensis]